MAKTLHQPAPGLAVVTFNDAPCKTAGGTIRPKWPWSDQYRRTVQNHVRELSAAGPVAGRSWTPYSQQDAEYAKLWAVKYGIDYTPTTNGISVLIDKVRKAQSRLNEED